MYQRNDRIHPTASDKVADLPLLQTLTVPVATANTVPSSAIVLAVLLALLPASAGAGISHDYSWLKDYVIMVPPALWFAIMLVLTRQSTPPEWNR